MGPNLLIQSFGALCVLLLLGKYLRIKIKLLQRLYLPSSLIGGVIGLVFLSIARFSGYSDVVQPFTTGWDVVPAKLINVVFAALFLGVSLPSFRVIWRQAAPQLAYSQIVLWGQYAVGLGTVLLLLSPLFGTNALFGVIVPIGFAGGHGTAGGLGPTFEQLNWQAGLDFSLASATVGIISGLIAGVILINWAARKKYASKVKNLNLLSPEEAAGFYPLGKGPSLGCQTSHADSIDSLALHLAMIGLAVFLGYLIKEALIGVESIMPFMNKPGSPLSLFKSFPLFPLCMIGGMILQFVLAKTRYPLIDSHTVKRISGTALDFLVVAAVSMINLSMLVENIVPFIIIMLMAIIWNVFCLLCLARYILPDHWFERAIVELGQAMGVTATGLLLLRMVDPDNQTPASSAFAYKQMIQEPFMGAFVPFSLVLVAGYGGLPMFIFSMSAILFWCLIIPFMNRQPVSVMMVPD